MSWKIRWRNARAVVQQIRRGEWEPQLSHPNGQIYVAVRGGRELWLANGGWFCDVDETNAFGLVLRHYVWWCGARRLARPPIPNLVEE